MSKVEIEIQIQSGGYKTRALRDQKHVTSKALTILRCRLGQLPNLFLKKEPRLGHISLRGETKDKDVARPTYGLLVCRQLGTANRWIARY